MDPLLLVSLASLAGQGAGALMKNKQLKKREEEDAAKLAEAKAEPVGQSPAERELERRLAIDPLQEQARKLVDEGERQVQAAGLTNAADIPGIQSRVAGQLLPVEQRSLLQLAKYNMEQDAREEEQKRQREAALEAVQRATEVERANIGTDFLGSAVADLGMAAGSNPEAFTDLRKNTRAFMDAGLDEETAGLLAQAAKDDDGALKALIRQILQDKALAEIGVV